VNPTGEYAGQYNLNYTLSQAQRFSKKGYRIYLDFHFADSWADPSKQPTPAEWPTSLSGLSSTLRNYVKSTLVAFKDGGVSLSLVSLGNEIRHGMLWPTGYVDVDTMPASARTANFTNFAELWAAARAGVNDAVSAGVTKPQVMIHIDDGWNKTLQLDWFGALVGTGKVKTSDWDVFGFSFYPFYGTAATLANLADSLAAVSKQYQKPVHVVETDWPDVCNGAGAPALSDTSVPISVQGQTTWVRDIVSTVKNVPGGWGAGVNYWEPSEYILCQVNSSKPLIGIQHGSTTPVWDRHVKMRFCSALIGVAGRALLWDIQDQVWICFRDSSDSARTRRRTQLMILSECPGSNQRRKVHVA